MRLCRISHESLDGPRYAVLEENSRVLPLAPDYNFEPVEDTGEQGLLTIDEVKLLAPVSPSKIVCVGRNYREHAAELGNKMPDEPLLFLKSTSPSFAISDGLVVTPSARPRDAPSRISLRFAVSRKNFIMKLPLNVSPGTQNHRSHNRVSQNTDSSYFHFHRIAGLHS